MLSQWTSDKNHFLLGHTPFDKQVILIHFEGQENFSTLFGYHLELISLSNSLAFETILGKSVTVEVDYYGKKRYFNGIINQFKQGPTYLHGAKNKKFQRTRYYATLVPKLWLLTQTENCAIFQEKSALDIIKEILSKHGIQFEAHVSTYGLEKLDFCVQFNESDFAFISRLMEKYGIFYYFAHKQGQHMLMLSDDSLQAKPCPHAEEASFYADADHMEPLLMGIKGYGLGQSIVPSTSKTTDYNFETPDAAMLAQTKGKGLGGDVYYYPGAYFRDQHAQGEKFTKLRIEEAEAPHLLFHGESNVPFFCTGYTTQPKEMPREDLNGKDFLFEKLAHTAQLEEESVEYTDFETQNHTERPFLYKNHFTALPRTVPYRPPRRTPQPKIYSPQTAIVTGKAGEEIWTDQYGRIKVKFHWDLSDTTHDKTSCWMRVAERWTGNNWGFVFTPRIGQEVIVQFVNGDPDHPLVTACVYNHNNMPPYLPSEPTISTIKTNTVKGGGGFNELRFQDKKGQEQVYIHAQKNMLTDVINDKTTTVEKGNRSVTVEKGNDTTTVSKGNQEVTVATGNRTVKVKGNQTTEIEGNQEVTIKGNRTVKVTGNDELQVTGNVTIKVTGTMTIDCTAGPITIKSGTNIMMKGGAAVEVQGPLVTVEASGPLTLKGSPVLIG